MAGYKDHTVISLDNILRLDVQSLSVDERQRCKDYMSQVKENFLSQFTVDRHQKVVKHGEIVVASFLPLLQISNVSKPYSIQSIKQYVDQ